MSRNRPLAARAAGLLATALVAAGCSAMAVGDEVDLGGAVGATTGPTVRTPVPARRVPTAADPLRVLMVGDSVAGEAGLAVEYALESGGAATVDVVSVPSLPRTPDRVQVWQGALASHRPEVVIVLIGYWESAVLGASTPAQLPPPDTYLRDELQPFADQVAAVGSELVWVGPPQVADPAQSPIFTELSRRFAALAEQDPNVVFVDANALVDDGAGGFTEVIEGPGGARRVRMADGLHLCPDGSELVGGGVLDVIVEQWQVPLGVDWQHGPWRTAVFAGAEECPPVS